MSRIYHYFYSSVITIMVMIGVISSHGVFAASTWQGPATKPFVITGLGSLVDLTDLVNRVITSEQALNGPLVIGSQGNYPAFVGYAGSSARTIGLMAVGSSVGTPYTPDLTPLPANSKVGLYGYALDGAANVGVYGESATAGGIGIDARSANATGYAGYFYGAMDIATNGTALGTLYSQYSTTGSKGIISVGTASLTPPAGTDATAIRGSSSSGVSSSIGVHGVSAGAEGVKVQITDENTASRGQIDSSYGLYGKSDTAAGIKGEVGSSLVNARALYGYSLGGIGLKGNNQYALNGAYRYKQGSGHNGSVTGPAGVGIHACGLDESAYVNGTVRMQWSIALGASAEQVVEDGSNTDRVVGKVITPEVTMTYQDLLNLRLLCGSSCVIVDP